MARESDASRLRQKLLETERERRQHVNALLRERGPLIPGTYVQQPGRCGKPNCKCSRGEFHASGALYGRVDGVQRCYYVPLDQRPRVEELNGRHRRFREARAALAQLARTTLELADELREAMTEPYPPSRPDSTKRRSRGRPPQDSPS